MTPNFFFWRIVLNVLKLTGMHSKICKIPHLDINVGNIALRSQGCILMDWDLVTPVENSTLRCRTVSIRFLTILILA